MSIGKKLREARTRKKITLDEAYECTRIHPDVLKALEQEEYEKILNPTYIRSFLKGYASYLGLDADKIIEEYNKLKPQKVKYQRPQPPLEKSVKSDIIRQLLEWLSGNAKLIIKWVIILIIGIVALKGVFIFTRYIKQRQIAKRSQTEQLKSRPATKTTAKADSKKPQVQETSSKAIVISKGEALILALDATEDVWLRLKVDEKIIFENIMKKGTSESWKAENNFTIWTGKAQALQLTLNGNYLGPAGKGVVRDLVIDRKGIKK